MSSPHHLDLEQLRKQAKELVRERRAAGEAIKLSDAQLELARRHGLASWPKLKAYLSRLGAEQPFHTDLGYYEGRADGIATTAGVTTAEARLDLARRHGFASWSSLAGTSPRSATGASRRRRSCSPTAPSRRTTGTGSRELLDAHPELVEARGTNGNDLLGMAGDLELVRLLLERGADPNRGNDYGWTKLHQAGYSNRPELAQLLLDAGGRLDLSARGDGGTPLVAALFWGHREVVRCSGSSPATCASPPGSGYPS